MSLDNKTQSYVVNSFLENNSYFHKNAKFAEGKRRHSAGLLAGTRHAPRDSFSRIGFFDTRREAAFPQRQSLGEAAQPAGGIPARGMIAPLLRRSLMFRTRAAGTGLRPRMTYPRFRYAFPKRGTSAGKSQPQGVPAGALISRS